MCTFLALTEAVNTSNIKFFFFFFSKLSIFSWVIGSNNNKYTSQSLYEGRCALVSGCTEVVHVLDNGPPSQLLLLLQHPSWLRLHVQGYPLPAQFPQDCIVLLSPC